MPTASITTNTEIAMVSFIEGPPSFLAAEA
jgi:hypothetical protein